MFKEIVESNDSIEIKRIRIMELVIIVSRAASQEGANRKEIIRLNGELYSNLIMIKHLEDIIEYVMELVSRYEHLVRQNNKTYSAKIVSQAENYIKSNFFLANLDLKSVAKEVNLSPNYFSKLFKIETGLTFLEYLTKIRLSNAKKLLGNSELTIAEIAVKIGYNDACYFSRLFKKHENFSPRKYREVLVEYNKLN